MTLPPAVRRCVLNAFRLTRREYFADFFITPPITLILLAVSLHHFNLFWLPLFVVGLFAWTFYEYATHRWLLHRAWFFRDLHGLHHADQRDYIAMHPLATVAIYIVFAIIFGAASSAFMVGFTLGYVIYSVMHTIFHYGSIPRGSLLHRQKTRHAFHHARADVNFGVITNIWDRVFSTSG